MGELPEWYRTIKAAQILNVPPWELAEQPLAWQEWAVAAQSAEESAHEEQRKRQERKAGSAGKRRR